MAGVCRETLGAAGRTERTVLRRRVDVGVIVAISSDIGAIGSTRLALVTIFFMYPRSVVGVLPPETVRVEGEGSGVHLGIRYFFYKEKEGNVGIVLVFW